VKIRRIFEGALVVLVLCVSSLAAACDLSCGFALFGSDCHSPKMAAADSGHPEMTMVGMTMSEMAGENSTIRPMVFHAPQAMRAHAALSDLGACERQPCDQGQALASKANHSAAAQFDTVSIITGSAHTENLRAAFHESHDDIPLFNLVVHSPFDVSLRI
jgi:hypothetical protein